MCSCEKAPKICQRKTLGAELCVCCVTTCMKMEEKSINLDVRVLVCLGGSTMTLFVYKEGNCMTKDGRHCKNLKILNHIIIYSKT